MNILAMKKANKGFTLIELLVVIGIIAILAGVVIIAINPARQFAQARDTQRTSNVRAILDAIGQRMADNQGVFETGCTAGAVSTTVRTIGSSTYDIAPCLVPTYIATLPFDPKGAASGYSYTDTTNYNTGYTVVRNSSTNRITVAAPQAEINVPIAIER
jgi:type IV pilus assembly protein PilA